MTEERLRRMAVGQPINEVVGYQLPMASRRPDRLELELWHVHCWRLKLAMILHIPRRYFHFVFGILQSGLTCLIAAGIGSFPASSAGEFLEHWFLVWIVSWATMLPVVVVAAPVLRALANHLTQEEGLRRK